MKEGSQSIEAPLWLPKNGRFHRCCLVESFIVFCIVILMGQHLETEDTSEGGNFVGHFRELDSGKDQMRFDHQILILWFGRGMGLVVRAALRMVDWARVSFGPWNAI